MQWLMEFLTFRRFVSFPVLLVWYYLGALGIPLLSWYVAIRIKRKYWIVSEAGEMGQQLIREHLRPRDQAALIALILFLFLSMETMWRVLFEYLIGYLQMRDALMSLTK